MGKIKYPEPLQKGGRIVVNAPSSGVTIDWKAYMDQAKRNVEAAGYEVSISDSVWSNVQLTSAPKEVRAKEMQQLLQDRTVQAIVPVWGGEFLFRLGAIAERRGEVGARLLRSDHLLFCLYAADRAGVCSRQ